MKSSKTRFKDFQASLRRGLLVGDRLRDPEDKSEPKPDQGGRHGGPPGGKHVFKRSKLRLLDEYRTLLRGYWGAMAVLIGVVIVGSINALVTPYVLELLIDYVVKRKPLPLAYMLPHGGFRHWLMDSPFHDLSFLAIIVIGVAVVGITMEWVRLLAYQRVNFRMAAGLRQRLHNHLNTLSLAQLQDYKTGGIVSRIMGDTDQVVGGIQNAIVTPASAMLRMVMAMALMFAISWKLSLALALLIPPILIIHMFMFRRLRPLWRNIQDERSMLSAKVTDMFAGIRVVRSFRRERSENKEFGARQNMMVRKQRYTAILGRLLSTGWAVFGPAMGVVIIWYGGDQVLNGKLMLGELIMFQSYIFLMLGPITAMIESLQNLQQNLGALDRVCDVLSQPAEMPDAPGATPLADARGQIDLRHVSFGYGPEREVLHNVDLHVPAGATVAIVGPSGSGKSTLVNLVARFFDVSSGAIFLDGIDIRTIKREDYRSLFAMVLQDVYLFDGTALENIAYGRRGASREDIIAAAKQANAHDFIMESPRGYDTQIGERGAKLSGGQKQRISIARAILADPRILILDEATSALDSHSEHLIQQSLNDLMEQRTTLVIAHRLSTIMHADQIVVIVEGRVVEQGTHQELLDRQGMYHMMFTQQFQRHRDPAMEHIDWETVEQKG